MPVYPPIADYALLGDGRTAALVSRDGSIDWLCWPDFDSPSLFGALVDAERGGAFRLGTDGPGAHRRRYLPGTNILETSVDTPSGAASVIDFLAVEHRGREDDVELASRRALVRLVRGTSGSARLDLRCAPRPEYATRRPILRRISTRAVAIEGPDSPLLITASVPLAVEGDDVVARIGVARGEEAWVILAGEQADVPDGRGYGRLLLDETTRFWRRWLARMQYRGPHAAHVERSALTLKALIYAPTGALIAAPSTSLPEREGGKRNWDYRFSWVRDATLSLAALHALGYAEEARRFFRFLFDMARAKDAASLATLYTIRGEHSVPERTIGHLAGYRGSRPVRVGNAAAGQLQLDIWGELVDTFFTFRDHLGAHWADLAACFRMVDWVAANWRRRDRGIWEVRSEPREFVHSRVMCWAALDRGIRLAQQRLAPRQGGPFFACHADRCFEGPSADDVARWERTRDEIREEVLARGFDERLGAFVQAYDHRVLDASVLRLPLVGFIDARDRRMRSTIERIRRDLTRHGLVYRYHADDGLPGEEHAFALCTFWLVEALALMGREQEAVELYRHALAYSNDVGLFSEEIDPATSAQWGNFPQAFTHLGVLRAAVRLHRGRLRPPPVEAAWEEAQPETRPEAREETQPENREAG